MAIDTTNLPYDPATIYDHPMVEHTQSSLSTFQTCPQKYVLRYLLRLRPIALAVPLVIGKAFHAALETQLDAASPPPPTPSTAGTHISTMSPANITQVSEQAIHKVFDETLATSEIFVDTEKLEYGRAQAVVMYHAWNVINGGWTSQFRMVHTEYTMRASATEIPRNPESLTVTCGPNTTYHPRNTRIDYHAWLSRMAGKVDGLVQDITTGEYWIWEHKTRYSLSDTSFLAGLDLNHQTLFYKMLYDYHDKINTASSESSDLVCNCGAELNGSHDHTTCGPPVPRNTATPFSPKGFLYDVVVKPRHRLNAKLASGAFNDLVQRMQAAMVEQPNNYFSFTPIEIPPSTVAVASDNFLRTLKQIDSLSPSTVVMRTSSCELYDGCPYQSVCKAACLEGIDASNPAAIMSLPVIQQYQLSAPHPELSEESPL